MRGAHHRLPLERERVEDKLGSLCAVAVDPRHNGSGATFCRQPASADPHHASAREGGSTASDRTAHRTCGRVCRRGHTSRQSSADHQCHRVPRSGTDRRDGFQARQSPDIDGLAQPGCEYRRLLQEPRILPGRGVPARARHCRRHGHHRRVRRPVRQSRATQREQAFRCSRPAVAGWPEQRRHHHHRAP